MKKFCPAFLALLLCCNAQAKPSESFQLLFLKNHFSAGFAFPVMLAKHESHTGLGRFEMQPLPGFEMKFEYAYNFNPYISVASGAHFGIMTYGYKAEASSADFSLPETLSKNYLQTIPFFSIPLLLSPRIFIAEKHMLQADLGGSILFYIPAGTMNTMSYFDGGDMKRVFEMKLNYRDSPVFLLRAGFSYGMVLPSRNIVKICCAFDYGRSKVVQGFYTFYGDDMKVGYGKMHSALSALSVGISYVFTRAAGIQKG